MKKLNELYENVESNVEIKGIKINSKEVEPGDIFVCTMGVTTDRHDFIDDAIKHGASAIVVSKDVKEVSVPVIKVADTNKELPYLCSKFYDYPEQKLKMIGVTGTDGKTTTSTIIQSLIGDDRCGYIGTNGCSCAKFKKDVSNTTPDSDKLYGYLKDFLDSDCKYATMEVSSEAYFRKRLENMFYDVSVITNITPEHLNIHKTFDNYVDCKCRLFEQTKKDGFCVLNHDDPLFERIKKHCQGQVLSYGRAHDATLQILDYKVRPKYTKISIKYQEENYHIDSSLVGEFNVYNLCAALLATIALGFNIKDLLKKTDELKVDGREEILDTDTPYYVMIDYAHTPNGITNILNFVHTLDINRSIVVIGSAGERDFLKRPIMGKTILDNASYAIFTYEDPRSENPRNIIEMLIKDVKDYDNYEIVVDRHEAIEKAIMMAKDNDMVLILGKGNETYQKLKDQVIYFNDVEEAYKAVAKRKAEEKLAEA